jgi:hypothetical protein
MLIDGKRRVRVQVDIRSAAARAGARAGVRLDSAVVKEAWSVPSALVEVVFQPLHYGEQLCAVVQKPVGEDLVQFMVAFGTDRGRIVIAPCLDMGSIVVGPSAPAAMEGTVGGLHFVKGQLTHLHNTLP